MSTEQGIPAKWLKDKSIELVAGDEYSTPSGITEPLTIEGAINVNADDNINGFIVSFADRPNTGKQPVGDDVVVDVSWYLSSDAAGLMGWTITHDTETWKPNHAAMLKQFKSEQGANMNTFTKENTLYATGYAIITNDDAVPCFYKDNGEFGYEVLYSGESWSKCGYSPIFSFVVLLRPESERKEAHTIDGVVTYALRYKLDLLTEEATHCYKKCPTFYRLTLGKYAAVLKDNSVWVTSDCTTNAELNGDEFFALDADQDNHKEDAHHIAIMIEKLGNQQQNHIDLAISAGAVDDIVISPDEPEEQLKADDDKLKLIEQLKNCFYDNRHDSLISALDKALVGFNISRKKD